MPIIKDEVMPRIRGTKGKLFSEIEKANSGQSVEFTYTEFDWLTEQKFQRTINQYVVQYRKVHKKEISITWNKTGFKIYVL